MLFPATDITGRSIRATDGAIGSVADLLFDDEAWVLRWAVIDTGSWLPGRRVLVPPAVLGRPEAGSDELAVDMTSERIRRSPGLATDAPVSRQLETELYSYYGWTPYWGADAMALGGTMAPVPPVGPAGPAGPVTEPPPGEGPGRDGDEHLRSIDEVTGYYIGATDGEIGHVEDFLIEAESWAIRYLAVDTRNWWPGRMVLVSPRWARSISWRDQEVRLALTRRQVEESPEYDPSVPVAREYEARLHAHYDQPPYWAPEEDGRKES